MKISIWHESLKTYLKQQFPALTKWEGERPQALGETTAFLAPLSDVYYYRNGESVIGSATQSVLLMYRLTRTMIYDEIPIGLYEGVHGNLSIKLVTEFGSIADIYSLKLQSINPISITELTDGKGDWVLQIQWMFNIQWTAETETVVLPRYNITEVNANIRRALAQDGKQPVTLATPNTIDNRLIILRDNG